MMTTVRRLEERLTARASLSALRMRAYEIERAAGSPVYAIGSIDTQPMGHTHSSGPAIDVLEHGAPRDGQAQTLDRRLFMQLLAFDCDPESGPVLVAEQLRQALRSRGASAVLYADVQQPEGLALLTWGEDPSVFVDEIRPAFNAVASEHGLRTNPAMCMMGRTYSTGFEPDLDFWLIRRPQETVTNADWPWAVWYPLRRGGAFEKLDPKEKGTIMREHATIGRAYGEADLAHDVRLACHGIDANDNEFLIGLVGKELYPLSHVVQSMRGTRQTSEFITQMGPFFVGKRLWALLPDAE